MRRLVGIGLVTATTLLASVPSSFAQSEGVTIDPDSPSGKEYQLPLENVRRQANPRAVKGRIVQGARSSPLFGEGIVTPRGNASSSGNPEAGAQGAGSATPRLETDAKSADRLPAGLASTRPGAPDGGIGTPMLVLGIAVLLMGVGTLSGLLLRRRSRSG